MGYLIVGTIWFWLLLLVGSGVIMYFLESALEKHSDTGGGIWATVCIIGLFVAYYYLGSSTHLISLLSYIKTHPFIIIAGAIGYLLCGVVWSIFKWYFFVLKKMNKLDDELKHDSNTYRIASIDSYTPHARENKARIISWMTYWPFSGLWMLINDPIRKTFQHIYRSIENYFDAISNKMFAGLKEKYAMKREPTKN